MQKYTSNNTEYRFNTENDYMQPLSIDGINALYYQQNGKQTVTWTDNRNVFTLVCPTSIQLEDMIDIQNITQRTLQESSITRKKYIQYLTTQVSLMHVMKVRL